MTNKTFTHHGERLQAARDLLQSASSMAARPDTIARRSSTIATPNVMKDARSMTPASHQLPFARPTVPLTQNSTMRITNLPRAAADWLTKSPTHPPDKTPEGRYFVHQETVTMMLGAGRSARPPCRPCEQVAAG